MSSWNSSRSEEIADSVSALPIMLLTSLRRIQNCLPYMTKMKAASFRPSLRISHY